MGRANAVRPHAPMLFDTCYDMGDAWNTRRRGSRWGTEGRVVCSRLSRARWHSQDHTAGARAPGTGKTGPKPDWWSPGLGQGEGRGMMLTGCGASSGEMRMFRNQAELLAAQRRERAKCHGAVHFRMVKTMMNLYVNFYN